MDDYLKRKLQKASDKALRVKEILSGSINYKGADYSCWCQSDCRVQGTYYVRPENETCAYKNEILDACGKMVDTAERADRYY